MEKDKIVMPGDQLSTSEELLPGDGTYEENGIIKAAIVGKFSIDNKFRRAIVRPVTSTPVIVKKGDAVIADVRMVKPLMVVAEVIHVIGKNRAVSGDTNGTIHASEISQAYVKDAQTEYRTGDIVRAKVIQTNPSLQLSTKDRTHGAIKSLCVKCRYPLIKKGGQLQCDNCGNRERRKTAIDYGEIDLTKL